jgi:hypothetical protein
MFSLGCVSGCDLGEAVPFKCGAQGAFYVCVPQSAQVKAVVVSMQRAADALINKLPFFITWTDEQGKPAEFKVNPIGSSIRGYDGVPGQTTAGIVQTALRGAIELRFQASDVPRGELHLHPDIVSPELLSVAKETDQKLSVEKVAFNASQIASYLNDVTANFESLVRQIDEKAKQGTLKPPLTLEPSPIDRGFGLKLDPGFLTQARKEGAVKSPFPWLAVGAAGLLALGGIVGTAAIYRKKSGKTRRQFYRHYYYAK